MELDWSAGWMMMNAGPDITFGPRQSGLFLREDPGSPRPRRGIKRTSRGDKSETMDWSAYVAANVSDTETESDTPNEEHQLLQKRDEDRLYSSNMLKCLSGRAYQASQNISDVADYKSMDSTSSDIGDLSNVFSNHSIFDHHGNTYKAEEEDKQNDSWFKKLSLEFRNLKNDLFASDEDLSRTTDEETGDELPGRVFRGATSTLEMSTSTNSTSTLEDERNERLFNSCLFSIIR